ncbi:regulatory protein GemA [Comamonas testosteroni]|uniref:Regulatory protein GemA n=1 Tax=Comamonas testosteroni TaxID=285 RepID=A0A373FS34_COMTE|nr:regulatory protein GemA [Comamonas testosteroni]RGE46981.1 regulatory protein GemA [Comamonas testosteroni]
MTNNIAAIHTLKSKLQLSDDDYRALLSNLTGKSSSKDLTPQQREAVRDHLQGLAEKAGVATPVRRRSFSRSKAAASPRERKVWALWHQLYRDGKLRDNSAKALDHFVQRTVGVTALRFANSEQLNTLIEALKSWEVRGNE